MENLKINKMTLFVVFLIVIIAISLLAVNIFKNSESTPNNDPQPSPNNTPSNIPNNIPSDIPNNTPSNAQLNNAGYLGESKLFLVSANASYGVYSANAALSGGTFDNKECFVITAIIRSDYTAEELQTLDIIPGGTHSGRVYFAVSATLYDGTSQVPTNDVTGAIVGSMSSPLGVPQWSIYCGEIRIVEIYLVINTQSIDNYSLNLKMIDLSGLPIP